MKKVTHHKLIDQNKRCCAEREPHMIVISISGPRIPESIAKAHDRVQSLVERSGDVSLEQLQGAVEYLLDTVKAARGLNG